VRIVDPGTAAAQEAVRVLARTQPLEGKVFFEVSGDPDGFAATATLLSGVKIDDVRQVDLV
jgi:hypothetical protein